MIFAAAVAVSTLLLMLPLSTETGEPAPFRIALFTATSAITVTGLVVVSTPDHWSTFGEVAILASIQVGGFGIMTLASVLGLLVSRRLGLRTRLLAQSETGTLELGAIKRVIRGVALSSLAIEAVISLVLFARFWLAYDEGVGRAAYLAVFHGVSAFNNAGFALWSDSVVRFATDPWIMLPIVLGVILGSLGFPVLLELRRELLSPRLWSLHTKVTLLTSGLLIVGGTVAITAFEWANPGTLGPLDVRAKLLNGFFHGAMPRSGGFNGIDYSAMRDTGLFSTDVLMFIGGGSASAAGGIKVTTFMILFFAIVAEARGDTTVDAFNRRISGAVLRQALTVALISVAAVVTGTLTVLTLTDEPLDRVLFEVISAWGTVGHSTGITGTLPPAAQYVLVVLMFLGRLGPVTVASALALRERTKLYRLPEERPIIG
jgi:trk system potassium uptake protein TrkH